MAVHVAVRREQPHPGVDGPNEVAREVLAAPVVGCLEGIDREARLSALLRRVAGGRARGPARGRRLRGARAWWCPRRRTRRGRRSSCRSPRSCRGRWGRTRPSPGWGRRAGRWRCPCRLPCRPGPGRVRPDEATVADDLLPLRPRSSSPRPGATTVRRRPPSSSIARITPGPRCRAARSSVLNRRFQPTPVDGDRWVRIRHRSDP